MRPHNENKRFRRRVAAGGIGLFLIGTLFGALVMLEIPAEFDWNFDLFGKSAQQQEEVPEETPDTLGADAPRDAVVAGDAEVEWLVRFTKCGHETAIEPAGGIAGMTRKEIASAYPDYAIEIFDTAYVRIVKSAESYCPAHYTLSMGEDALVITKTDVDTLAPKEVMRIIADTSLLDEEALAALAAGVTFDSLEDINAYLEGAE